MTGAEFNASNTNLKIVKTELKPSGEAVQLVRPLAQGNKTSEEIVDELVNKFSYKTSDVKSTENELSTVQQAFGSNLANELIKTYEGSNLVSDSQQDLVGEKYLAEQIRLIQEQQKTSSFLDKWSHLLYEGERDYKSPSSSSRNNNNSGNEVAVSSVAVSGGGGSALDHHAASSSVAAAYGVSTSASGAELGQSCSVAASNSVAAVSSQLHQSNSYFNMLLQQQQQQQHEQLRLSNSRQSINSNGQQQQQQQATSSQGNVPPAASSYVQSQSGIQSRTLSECRLQPSSSSQQQAQSAAAVIDSTVGSSQAALATSGSQYSRAGLQESQSRTASQLANHQQQQEEILAYAQQQALSVQQQQQQQQYQSSNVFSSSAVASQQFHPSSSRHSNSRYASSAAVAAVSSSPAVAASGSASVSASAAAAAASNSCDYHQPQPYLPNLSSSNLNSVSLEAYNSPQFKAMLEQLSKPISIPPEQINYPPDWPSQDKINLLAEPIYIPAPQPIVIPAPNIVTLKDQSLEDVFERTDLPEDALKPTVTYYPSIANDQAQYSNFGIRQIDTNVGC